MPSPSAGAISLRGLRVSFRSHGRDRPDTVALDGVDLEVAAGCFATIIGPSGCGKSTLLRVVAGLVRPDAGLVEVGGRSPDESRAAKEIGFVPQAPALLPWRSVLDNVRLPLQVNRRPSAGSRSSPSEGSIAPELLLERLGLTAVADKRPHELSGGMAQRVAIARAFVFGPPVLVMDEPFSALDELTRETARQVLLDVWDLAPRTVLWVTHSVTEAVLLGDQVVVMTAGPGRVAAVVAVDLPRPRSPEIETTPAGVRLVAAIRGLLRQGAGA